MILRRWHNNSVCIFLRRAINTAQMHTEHAVHNKQTPVTQSLSHNPGPKRIKFLLFNEISRPVATGALLVAGWLVAASQRDVSSSFFSH